MSRTGPTGGTLPATPLYRNPFRKASVTAERIDQGVDYAGRPGDPIYALGNGKVLETFPFGGGSGWPGGGWISYQLTDGPAAGQVVYIAESVQPAVTAGQRVTPNTVVAHFGPGGGIETGFAGPPSQGDNTLAYSQRQSDFGGSDIGGWTTLAGAEFSNLIASTGGPAGIPQAGGVHGPGGALVPGFKFGKGGPSSGPGGGGGGTLPADCLIGLPSAKAFIIAGPTIGGGCIITRSEARALAGAGLMLIGGGLLLIGTLILAAYGLRGSGAGQKAATAAQAAGGAVALVPGGEPAGAVIAATATAAKQRGSSARAKAATGVVRKQRAREAKAVAADQRKKKAAAAKQQQQIKTASRPAPAKKGP